MKKSDYKIHIIGAGISGLIAAQVLENYGYHPKIIEATNTVGGRVKSDIVNDYILDHGFQVLLSEYPAAKKYLNYQALDLQKLVSGAVIFKDGKTQKIGDPFRDISLLFPTIFANIGSTKDKLKILKLNTNLKKKKLQEIFNTDEITTHQYLKNYGFSENIMNSFFKPFFSGIFLEPNLETSSRMFEFVYKMFGEGHAVIPKEGIQAISNQLKNNLQHTTFLFNTPVQQVKNNSIILNSGQEIKSHFTIIATEASNLVSNLKNQETEWKSCDTLYFEVPERTLKTPIIGLVAEASTLINNIFYTTSVKSSTKGKQELLSVTIVKEHQLKESDLVNKVTSELIKYCNIIDAKFIKRYCIKKALPKLSNLQYEISSTETQLTSSIFLAGDQLLNGSLNAAMISGERAAMGIIKTLEDGLIVDELTSEY
ncbi:FAD-dependent oxidoreductase [Polaribacter septentrionalilitoris]|uniref:FAD-dependent oxidoreductase n=1 Tax=Polaribacter septentrionalilitoris TaxID=2494657 RepID=UPI0013597216|nr:FAD-dependent oxidoreductase [Polaribacter septentrionalilitoris]